VYNIPEEYKQYFDKLPTTDIITDGHKQKALDVNTITSYCEQIINCG
jgi:hypothetical protein